MAANANQLRIALRGALQRLGFNQASRNYLTDEGGYNTIEDIAEEDADTLRANIKDLNRDAPANVRLSGKLITKLMALHYWAAEKKRLGRPLDADEFQLADSQRIIKIMTAAKQREKLSKGSSTPPDKLKDMNKFDEFYEAFKTYLSKMRGEALCPLTYILREHVEVTEEMFDADYEDEDERLCMLTPLNDLHYKHDNATVFTELKPLVLGGPGEEIIKRFDRTADGRGAILALQARTCGEAFKTARVQQATALIQHSNYTGEKPNFDFMKYINNHEKAHNMLVKNDDPMSETAKVTSFINHITDPKLESAVNVVRSNRELRHNFNACADFLQMVVEEKKSAAKLAPTRRLASVGGTKRIHTDYYTSSEWKKLSEEEQAKVRALREEQGVSKRGKGKGRKRKRPQRKVSAASKAKKARREEEAADDEDAAAASEQSKPQFGRAAHAASKKKKDE